MKWVAMKKQAVEAKNTKKNHNLFLRQKPPTSLGARKIKDLVKICDAL